MQFASGDLLEIVNFDCGGVPDFRISQPTSVKKSLLPQQDVDPIMVDIFAIKVFFSIQYCMSNFNFQAARLKIAFETGRQQLDDQQLLFPIGSRFRLEYLILVSLKQYSDRKRTFKFTKPSWAGGAKSTRTSFFCGVGLGKDTTGVDGKDGGNPILIQDQGPFVLRFIPESQYFMARKYAY